MEHLFVYGTLAPNRSNHHIMTPITGIWQTATARGFLHAKGWGLTQGYPAIIPDDEGDEVSGFVFSSDELSEHWDRLDAFEGAEYQRVPIVATLDNGDVLTAFVYVLNASLPIDDD
ncbi:gamma-glutamylcyclotransferase [Moraxella nasibovis]|uniref:gamma-glutamylcyclotransferase family protein n=1 Tax=Moraxella nasibovis TaxID=2904120 RepID=UPI00241001A8|nr:gamma-glutamylcyclotransferase family protein [Moraxella nasibovis]WFF38465.1 gamma-glutamylcyclotransferase [Moraxella nasibovis]